MSRSSFFDLKPIVPAAREERFFSVVIPLYNKEKSIKIALSSVLNQTHEAFEVVVVDDGSTDQSASVVASVRDHRVRLIRQPNCGVSAARNAGVKHARSDYIAFLDADDCWQPDFLETINGLVDMNPAAGVFATAVNIEREDGQIVRVKLGPHVAAMRPGQLQHYFRAATFGVQPIHSSGICISRKAFEEVGGFKPGVKYGEDVDMWARLALRYPIMFTPEPKALYRLTAEHRALVSALPLSPWAFHEEVRQLMASGELSAELAHELMECLAKIDLFTAITNVLNPDRKAVLSFLRGIRTKAFWRKKIAIMLFMRLPLALRKAVLAVWRRLRV